MGLVNSHLSSHWEKYDHGYWWLCGKDVCPACGKKTSRDEAFYYMDEKRISLAELKELALKQRLKIVCGG